MSLPTTANAYLAGSGKNGRNLKFQDWAKTIEVPVYEKMNFIPSIDDAGRPYSQKNLRFWDTLTPVTADASTLLANDNMTWSNGTPTTLTITPARIYVAVAYDDPMQDEVEVDLGSGVRQNIELALAEGCDAQIMTLITSLSNGIGDAAYVPEATGVRKLIAQLRVASAAVEVGKDTIQAIAHGAALDGLQNTADFMNAEVRGDAENPQVRGIFTKAAGVLWKFTNKVVTTGGNGGEGAIYHKSAFAVGWNTKPRVERQRDGLATFYIGYANLGGLVKWSSRARYFRTVTTP